MIRIDRLLSQRGYSSRSGARSFLENHEVLAAGNPVQRTDERVDELTITIDGEPIDPPIGLVLILNKPLGYTCSRSDSGPLVYELLPERLVLRHPEVQSVGRLDKETSGLLLFTDDGQLLHRLTSPKYHLPRCYEATLARPLRGDEAEIFASGTLLLNDETKPLLPAEIEVVDEQHCRVTITEGRYHQVRRMFAAVGNHVETLSRLSFGPLTLDGLPEGEFRYLETEEITRLRQ